MEQLKLDQQLCFPLYAASRLVTGLYRPLLEELSLTYPQYLVLLVLWEKESVTVKELGEQLWLDSGTLTPLLKRMQEKNLVTRTRSSDDERVVNITLTEAGKDLQAQAAAIPNQLLSCLHLEPEQAMQLREQLQHFLVQHTQVL
ncbi:MarR family winged helix-turn-helix transcriptional regulator [Siphonobacter curvatus]|nr:MarR family transcriptional regulator [Siphonobacter curvatus]